MSGLKKHSSENRLLTKIGICTVQLGLPCGFYNESPPTETKSIHFLREAHDMGINFSDTAPAYGTAEYLLGKSFENQSTRPLISTKVSLPQTTSITLIQNSIEVQIENSRKQLYLDTLPLVMLRSVVGDVFYPSLIKILNDFIQKGIVGKWGVSTYGVSAHLRAMEYPKIFSAIQIPFNMLDRLPLRVLKSHPNALHFTFIVRSVFLQGLLTKNDKSDLIQLSSLNPFINKTKQIAACFDLLLSEICLRYTAYNSSIGIAIFDTQSLREFQTNLNDYKKGPLNNDIIEVIDDIGVERLDLLDPRNWPPNQ